MVLGLERLSGETSERALIRGNIALLSNEASVTGNLDSAVSVFKKIFGNRLKKLFGPQHGMVCDVQDNMVETEDFFHLGYKLPVYSLYGKVRAPTDESLEGIDTFVVDLQDVGTRVYTYISTLVSVMKKCASQGISVVVLDRPNPVGGEIVEGPVLKEEFKSFVGLLKIPQRHSLTIGEVAIFAQEDESIDVDLSVIKMLGWERHFCWKSLDRFWINPSPNLSTQESAVTFCGTVLFEGTNLSEGRGTTRSLECVGHPDIKNPHDFYNEIKEEFIEWGFKDECILRPVTFRPMFQKYAGKSCGGFHIHPLGNTFRSWHLGQFLLKVFKRRLGSRFSWSQDPYEYEYDTLPIDLINGGGELRQWIDGNQEMQEFEVRSGYGREDFLKKRQEILLYPSVIG